LQRGSDGMRLKILRPYCSIEPPFSRNSRQYASSRLFGGGPEAMDRVLVSGRCHYDDVGQLGFAFELQRAALDVIGRQLCCFEGRLRHEQFARACS
jgi:hypothetical protein